MRRVLPKSSKWRMHQRWRKTLNRSKFATSVLALLTLALNACATTSTHDKASENFVVQRLIILNDADEILMVEDGSVWFMPSNIYKNRAFIKEDLKSLADTYGIQLTNLELRGQFSFKYDYESYATIRNYYVAQYAGGDLRVPEGLDAVQWIPVQDAIEKTTVTAIKQISRQIIDNPDTVWGGSFLISEDGESHPTMLVEGFYPLFEAN